MENLKVTVVEINPCKVSMDFEIPKETVDTETEKAFSEIQRNSKPSGFRQGKAPIALIRQKYASAAKELVVDNLIKDSVFPTLKEKNIFPLDSPVINKIEFEPNKPFKFSVTVEMHPKVQVKAYKDIKLKKNLKKVAEKDIEGAIADIQKYNTRLAESKSDTVEKGNCVEVTYEAYLDGKEIPDLRGENQLIDLSSEHILPGMVEGLSGAKKNEQKEISTKLPDDYPNKEYAGKTLNLKVKVQTIKEKILPKFDDEFAKDMGHSSVAELRKKISDTLEANYLREADEKLEEEIVDYLIRSNPIAALPESLVKAQEEYLEASFEQKLRYQGMPKETVDKQKETVKDKIKAEAEKQVKMMYIFNSIAEQEKITVSDEELNRKQDDLLKSNPGKEKYIQHQFSDKDSLSRLISRIKTDKIFRYILDNSKIKTVTVKT